MCSLMDDVGRSYSSTWVILRIKLGKSVYKARRQHSDLFRKGFNQYL